MSGFKHPNATTTPHVVKEEAMAEGKWLKLKKTADVDPAGNTRSGESVKRTTRPLDTEADEVGIIAILKRTRHEDCLVVLKQFRPALGCCSLEFPTGLIHQGEDADVAALRVLKEETGYKGEVVGVTPVTSLDPGLSNFTTNIFTVIINGDDIENINPEPQLEFVEVILVPQVEFRRNIDDTLITALLKKEKIVVDAKVYLYAMGVEQAFFLPNELPVLKQ